MNKSTRTFLILLLPPLSIILISVYVFHSSWWSAICCGCLSLFAFCDGWYFIRLTLVQIWEAYDNVKDLPRKHLYANSEIDGRVLLGDIDRNSHCNNARFLRECGFGRRHFWHVRT